MKEIIIYEVVDVKKHGDTYNNYFFTEKEAQDYADKTYMNLTKKERVDRDIYINGHKVIIPADAQYSGAEDLVSKLFNDEITAESGMAWWGFTDDNIIDVDWEMPKNEEEI